MNWLLLLTLAIEIPLGLDRFLPVPVGNPLTAEKVAKGRQLFFDKRLSRDGTVACASCHDPARAFSAKEVRDALRASPTGPGDGVFSGTGGRRHSSNRCWAR